ncbi:MAG TPA: hypothetical protein GXX20_04220 [Clostridiaceae bacterium]|nr:hypothetical protein [Clostridiaceae bacterium]
MTGRERLLCALNHKEPDTVPVFECVYSRPLFKEVLGYVPETFDPVSVLECSHRIGYDFAFIPIPGVSGFRPEGMKDTVYVDEWGIKRMIADNTWPIDAEIEVPLKNAEDWANYKMPDPEAEFRYKGLADCLKLAKEYGMGVVGNVRGPFSAAWQLFGMENFFIMLYEDPDTVHQALTASTEFSLACARRMAQMGVDAILYSDDYGSIEAPLLSPAHFREFIVPQLVRIQEETAKMGQKMLLHSDGNIGELIPDIMSTGIQGLHPIQRCKGIDLADIKSKYGHQVTIFGNIDNSTTLVSGTTEEIEEMVKECIRIAGPGGGYCLGSDHSVHDDIPNKNVFTVYEAARRYGKYPINI